jgi:hypothetical protein
MDRKALKLPFTLNRPNDWLCPTCHNGMLRIKEGTFHSSEIRNSRDHSIEDWEPERVQNIFSCTLICKNDQCKETVACAGVGGVDYDVAFDQDDQPHESYDEFFLPRFFEPHLKLINIPEMCPRSVSEQLNESFRLFFVSPSAASNNVRIAVEALLTALKVRRFNPAAKGRQYISLHDRINLLPARFSPLKSILLAIKWLGNAGSHGKVTMDDVMDSYDLIEHVLDEIYTPPKSKKLAALAKKVNKKRGPLKRVTKPPF